MLYSWMSTKWKPGDYQDEFRERLQKVIKERMEAHGVVKRAPEEPEADEGAATNVVDFMSLLQKSIDRNKRTPAKKAAESKPAPAKKAARKTSKAATKKTAAKSHRRKSA